MAIHDLILPLLLFGRARLTQDQGTTMACTELCIDFMGLLMALVIALTLMIICSSPKRRVVVHRWPWPFSLPRISLSIATDFWQSQVLSFWVCVHRVIFHFCGFLTLCDFIWCNSYSWKQLTGDVPSSFPLPLIAK